MYMHVCVTDFCIKGFSKKEWSNGQRGCKFPVRSIMHEIDSGSCIGGGRHDLDAKLKDVVMMVEEKI